MLVRAYMAGVASLGDNSSVRPLGTVCVELVGTVGLVVVLALAAVETGVGLRAHADALPGLDERYFRADAESCTDDFC